jgi:hypothetical protein
MITAADFFEAGNWRALRSHFYCTTPVKKETDSKAHTPVRYIRDLPHQLIHRLAQMAPRLQPEQMHRVIGAYGLEDCAELVAHATPAQLSRVFDLDLWRPATPGRDEQFDAERFGIWIEVLVEAGADLAAEKLSQMPIEQLVPGFAHHARVLDVAAIAAYETTDGERIESRTVSDALACDIFGYHIVARCEDAWDAIAAVLLSLGTHHRARFGELMSVLRSLSDSDRELDGLDVLLESGEQMMFDAGSGRERRRNMEGFASPADARAFLQMSRSVRPGVVPSPNPLARAYFRSIDSSPALDERDAQGVETDADVMELLADAGVLPQQAPQGLLTGEHDQSSGRLADMHRHMRFVFERNQLACEERHAELAYLANALIAGCSIQSRSFTAKEASDAAVSICNLGLAKSRLPDDYLIAHDLIGIFQIGWTALHEEVGMYAAKTLIDVAGRLRFADAQIRSELNTLRIAMRRQVQAGTPWRAEPALDVIAMLDQPAWAALSALIAECPVIHDALTASLTHRAGPIDAHAFTFIACDADIARVREFMALLPDRLAG